MSSLGRLQQRCWNSLMSTQAARVDRAAPSLLEQDINCSSTSPFQLAISGSIQSISFELEHIGCRFLTWAHLQPRVAKPALEVRVERQSPLSLRGFRFKLKLSTHRSSTSDHPCLQHDANQPDVWISRLKSRRRLSSNSAITITSQTTPVQQR